MTRPSPLLSYLRLLRLPNVFTAFGDILMATAAAGLWTRGEWGTITLLTLASGCLYCGGMVWNDLFDRHEDAKTRPFRPIPSGQVSVTRAQAIGTVLFVSGVGFASGPGPLRETAESFTPGARIALLLVAAILLYDGWLKRTPFGPLGMGLCRFLNVLLGFCITGVVSAVALHLAAVVGVYIVGVTLFARTEEGASSRPPLKIAAGIMASALVLALFLPTHLEPGASPWYFPYLLVLLGFGVGAKLGAAIRRPGPKEVQAAVKRSILGLIVLDAILATAFIGLPGLLIVLLLIPAAILGRWVYST